MTWPDAPSIKFVVDAAAERRNIAFDDIPDDVRIDAEISVDRSVTKPGDVLPRNAGVSVLELIGLPLGRLGQRLETVGSGVPDICLAIETIPAEPPRDVE